MSKICPRCGAHNADNSKYCVECGDRLGAQPDIMVKIGEAQATLEQLESRLHSLEAASTTIQPEFQFIREKLSNLESRLESLAAEKESLADLKALQSWLEQWPAKLIEVEGRLNALVGRLSPESPKVKLEVVKPPSASSTSISGPSPVTKELPIVQAPKPGLLASLGEARYVLYLAIAGAILGFLGYRFGFLNFVYGVAMPKAWGSFGLYPVAMIAGVAAFFSPCAFPMLTAYMTHYFTAVEEAKRKVLRSIYHGAVAGIGIILVNLALGGVIGVLGAQAPFTPDPREDVPLIIAVRVVAAIGIIAFGVLTLLKYSIFPSGVAQRVGLNMTNEKVGRSMFLYGLTYNAIGIGCTGPILLGLMLFAGAFGGFTGAITAFAIFAATMAVLMLVVTVLIGLAKGPLIKKLVAATPNIKKAGGLVMILAGIFTLSVTANNLLIRLFFPFLP